MYRWRIFIFGKTPARALGTLVAPDATTAESRAIEFYAIRPDQHFRVVAVKLDKSKQPDRAKVGARP
jgi:hypothetical protein